MRPRDIDMRVSGQCDADRPELVHKSWFVTTLMLPSVGIGK